MRLCFEAIDEDRPDSKWLHHFERAWPDYARWFLRDGDAARPGYLSCRTALGRHMPELVPLWDHLCELVGAGDREARMLSLYRPTPYMVACSQALWTRPGDEPALVRNYDYHPRHCEGLLLRSNWHGTPVLAMSDCMWGVLDGVNAHGLALSLAFGGRRVVGDGFGIPLVLRYALEFCRDVEEAVAVFERVPSHMSYTIAAVDRGGEAATIHVNPDRATKLIASPVSTNHQHDPAFEPEWPEHAHMTDTLGREAFLRARLDDPGETLPQFCARFQSEPIATRAYEKAFGTLYTAIYHPRLGRAEYRWPGRAWHQSLDDFSEGAIEIIYDDSDELML